MTDSTRRAPVPVFDQEGVHERLEGDVELIQEILGQFLAAVPGQVADIAATLAQGQPELVRSRAHALKGSAGNVGAAELAWLASMIELQVKNHNLSEAEAFGIELEPALARFQQVVGKVLAAAPARESAVSDGFDRSSLRFLIVEDDLPTRTLLAGILEGYGRIEFAHDGQTAETLFLQAISQGTPFSAVLLDFDLPAPDGLTVARQIRAHEKEEGKRRSQETPILMITSYQDVFMKSFYSGCSDYLLKPIRREDLLEKLSKILCLPLEIDLS
jgi:CheY-like chemotaxis protein